MFHHKINLFLILTLVLVFGLVPATQAAPPLQEPDSTLTSMGDSFNLDQDGHDNLGTVMSGKNDTDDVDDDDNDNDDTPDGDEGSDDADGDDQDGNTSPDEAGQHPVASALADYFDVPYDQVEELHDNGYGFGVIARAYFFADRFGLDFTELNQIMDGQQRGWRNVLNQLNALQNESDLEAVSVNGRGNSQQIDGPPGQAGRDRSNNGVSVFTGPGGNGNGNGNGNGRGNSNGNGNGVNGRPNDHPGGGNGNGGNNGDGNGNGNGRGNGRGNNK